MARCLLLSHGGGPLPLMGDAGHSQLVSLLTRLGQELPRPRRILVVSAHWESAPLKVLAAPQHPLYYDYYNFASETYSIPYPAAGCPELATKVQDLLANHDISCETEYERGYDHGMFVPLKILYPPADIPTIQLSLHPSMDPALHLRIGEALATLGDDTLVIGSGFSFHNQPAFRNRDARMNEVNQRFEAWLQNTLCSNDLSESQRRERLRMWELAPGAMACHPREEHLLPLHVCYAAAGKPADQHWQIEIMGKLGSFFFWS